MVYKPDGSALTLISQATHLVLIFGNTFCEGLNRNVNTRVIIRPAVKEDLEAICRLRKESMLETPQGRYSREQSKSWASINPDERMLDRILDACVLVGVAGHRIVACNSLDLDGEEMMGLFVAPAYQRQGIGRRMVTAIERLAIRYCMKQLRVDAATPSIDFFESCKYQPRPGASVAKDPRTEQDALLMVREFPKRQTRYGNRILRLLGQIGIPEDYGKVHRLPLQPEARELATVGIDARGRDQMLHPDAARAWYELRNAAEADGTRLQVVSAFRSVGYQVTIMERKLHAGQSLEEILRVSAAPGFSEHHSGRAIDIATPGSTPLEECFESTQAFEWLTEEAQEHGFRMSYPRNNRHGILYEPWHWAWMA